MASILVNSEQRLVVVLFGQQVELLWTGFPSSANVDITSSGRLFFTDEPGNGGASDLLDAVDDALTWITIQDTPPRDPLDLGPLWGTMFRFQDDDADGAAYYGVHDGVLGVKENWNLPAVLEVMKDWLENTGLGA